jgi:hypothetical protein
MRAIFPNSAKLAYVATQCIAATPCDRDLGLAAGLLLVWFLSNPNAFR